MRRASVRFNGRPAGELQETGDGSYRFRYFDHYLADPEAIAVSLTLPLRADEFSSEPLFPFFQSILAEGPLAAIQCRQLKIDERDYFGRLLATCSGDVIGAVTVHEET